MGDRTVALAQQAFMFYWKALKTLPPQLCREKGAPVGMPLMEADPVCNPGTLMTHCDNSVMIRDATPAPCNSRSCHAQALKVPVASF